MDDMIRIPYLGIEFHIDELFAPDTAQENKDIIEEIGDMYEAEIGILRFANCNFIPKWFGLEKRFGCHLYGLWDDCVEPQVRDWFGFPPSDHINEDRRHVYFDCRHKDIA